jgi:hypothetical protein
MLRGEIEAEGTAEVQETLSRKLNLETNCD